MLLQFEFWRALVTSPDVFPIDQSQIINPKQNRWLVKTFLINWVTRSSSFLLKIDRWGSRLKWPRGCLEAIFSSIWRYSYCLSQTLKTQTLVPSTSGSSTNTASSLHTWPKKMELCHSLNIVEVSNHFVSLMTLKFTQIERFYFYIFPTWFIKLLQSKVSSRLSKRHYLERN